MELLHHLCWYPWHLEVVRDAVKTAQEIHGHVLGFSMADLTCGETGKTFLLSEGDLIVIANGMATLQDKPEYNPNGARYQQFETLYNIVRRHLGKEFLL